MSDDRSQRDEEIAATESFEQWLERQAAADDISQEELFEQLVTSYWTLNEMKELLGTSDGKELSISRPSGGGAGEDPEAVRERLDRLEDRLEVEVERRQSLDPLVEAVADRLNETEERLEELAVEAEAAHSALDEKHESVAEETDTLKEELDQEREKRVTEHQELEAEQRRIKSRLDSEFDNLEAILTYLVSRTDELESDVSNVDTKHEEAFARIGWERDVLDSIKREAAGANVRSGECESCGEEIDIGMLARPYCPNCESTLTGIEQEQKWVIFSDVTVTVAGGSQGESARESDRLSQRSGRPQSASAGRDNLEESPEFGGGHSAEADREAGNVQGPKSGATNSEPAQNRRGGASETSDTTADAGSEDTVFNNAAVDEERPDDTNERRSQPQAGHGQDPKSDAIGSSPARGESRSEPSDTEDAGWEDTVFENPAVDERQPDETSEDHGQAHAGRTPAGESQNQEQDVSQPPDEEGESDDSDPDHAQSPFGDLSDLTTEE